MTARIVPHNAGVFLDFDTGTTDNKLFSKFIFNSLGILYWSSPFGPFTVTRPVSTTTVTSFGTSINFFPILDIILITNFLPIYQYTNSYIRIRFVIRNLYQISN